MKGLVINNGGIVCGAFVDGPILPDALHIGDAVKIYRDGRVEVNPAYESTDAARAFWEAVKTMAPEFLTAKTPEA